MAPKAAAPAAPKAPRARAATLVGIAPPVIPVVASAPRQELQAYEEGAVIADRYDLVRLIGKGGFGQVWMAKSRALDSMVALKLFVRAGTDIDGGAERLLAEARAAAQLEHPAIVRVFDFGETSRGDPFLVMELLRGESLEDVLERQGPMNPSRLAAILLPIVDALGTAHAKGIIHRDIKPANLFLGRSESRRSKPDSLGSVWLQPKVIDFGLVKRHEEGQLKITQEGALAGSPAYMSPEQVKGVKVDARTDIWSLSVVMYELLTNRMPFPVTSQYELFKALVERDPEPIVEHVDAGLVAIVMRGLAKPVDARWSSMHELGMELAEWLDGQGVKVDVSGASIRATWLDAHIPVSIVPPSMPSPTSPKVPALVTTQDRPAPAKSAGEMDALWRNVAAGVVAEPDAEELDAIEVEEILPLPIVEVAQAEPQAVAASVAPGATIIIKTPIVARASVQPPPRARPLLGMAIGALLTLGAGLAFIYVRGLPKEQSVSTPPTTPVSTPVAISATPVTTAAPTPTDTPSAATTPTSTPVVVDVPPPVPTPPVPSAHPSTKASAAVKPPPSSTAHVRPPVTTHPTAKPSATAKPDKELGF